MTENSPSANDVDKDSVASDKSVGAHQLVDALCILDRAWKVEFWNIGAQRLFRLDALTTVGMDLRDCLPVAFGGFYRAIERHLDERKTWSATVSLPGRGSAVTHVACRVAIEGAEDTPASHILFSAIELPAWSGVERRDELRQPDADAAADADGADSLQSFDRFLDQHPDGAMTLSRTGLVTGVNEALARLSGTAREALSGKSFEDLWDIASRDLMQTVFGHTLDGKTRSQEALMLDAQGKPFPVAITLMPNFVADKTVGLHGIVKDLRQEKEDQERILYLANHDSLTSLPNRRMLLARMQISLENARRNGTRVAILFMDVNRFKVINDSLGHDAGDELLRALAGRIRNGLREVDTVARIGGDEFVIILEAIEDAEGVATVANELARVMSLPILLAGDTICVTTSMGVSIFPDDGADSDTLLKNADLAMYAAKNHGKPYFQMYNMEMSARALKRLSNENSLRDAIMRNELVMHYQPRLDMQSNRIVGVEALVRWEHPERGLVFPNAFIPLAEEVGLIEALGEWVLSSACHQMAAWCKLGIEPLTMAVNVSALQLQSSQIRHVIDRILQEAELDPKCLELEITESSLMSNIDSCLHTLEALTTIGIALSIDDFGTGYSSLSYLKRLPVTTLKIDKSFIRGVCDDKDDAAIVHATVAMAHSMDIKVVAEGVTTFDQLRFLEQCRCDEIQGYLLCQPLPALEMEAYFNTCALRGIQYSWAH